MLKFGLNWVRPRALHIDNLDNLCPVEFILGLFHQNLKMVISFKLEIGDGICGTPQCPKNAIFKPPYKNGIFQTPYTIYDPLKIDQNWVPSYKLAKNLHPKTKMAKMLPLSYKNGQNIDPHIWKCAKFDTNPSTKVSEFYPYIKRNFTPSQKNGSFETPIPKNDVSRPKTDTL